jgi:hypothetical protein
VSTCKNRSNSFSSQKFEAYVFVYKTLEKIIWAEILVLQLFETNQGQLKKKHENENYFL